MNTKRLYAAYGSNLHIADMAKRCPSATIFGTARLENYALFYGGLGSNAYLSIEERNGTYVPLGIWSVSAQDEKFLDIYEDYPHLYKKINMTLEVKHHNQDFVTSEEIFIYILNEGHRRFAPSPQYVATCKQGFEDFGFDIKLLDEALTNTF